MEKRSSTLRQAGLNIMSQINTSGKFVQLKLSKDSSQIQDAYELSLSKDVSFISQISKARSIIDPSNKDGSGMLAQLGQILSKKVQLEILKQKQIQSEFKAAQEERKEKTLSIYGNGNTSKNTKTQKNTATKQNIQGTKTLTKPSGKNIIKGTGSKKQQLTQEPQKEEQPLDFDIDDIYESESHKKEATISITKLHGYQGVSANINKTTKHLDIIKEEGKKQDSDDDFEDFKTEMPEVNKINPNQQKYVTSYQKTLNKQQQNATTTVSTRSSAQIGTKLEEVLFLDQVNNSKTLKSYVIKRTKQIVVGSLFSKFLPLFEIKKEALLKIAVSRQTINFVTDRQSAFYDCSNEDDIQEFLASNISKYSELVYLQALAKGGEAIVYGGKTGSDEGIVVKCTIFDSQSSSQNDIHQAFLHILEETQQIILLNSLTQQLVVKQQMFPKILDEIVSINEQTKMIKQYVVIIERAECTLHDILLTWQDKSKSIENNERYHPLKLVYFFIKILEIVKFLHSINMYYGDMKPQNLLIFSDYSIKIGDFGISIMMDPATKITDKVHTLKGLTTAYSSINTLNAFKQRRKFSMQELKQLDRESLILTFEKCIRSVKDVHNENYPDIPLDIFQYFVTELSNGKPLKVIIDNQSFVKDQNLIQSNIPERNQMLPYSISQLKSSVQYQKNQTMIKDILSFVKRENNLQRVKALGQFYRVHKKVQYEQTTKYDKYRKLNKYFDVIVCMFTKEGEILSSLERKGVSHEYNNLALELQQRIQSIKIEPEDLDQKYKKDYLLTLSQIAQRIIYENPGSQKSVLDAMESFVTAIYQEVQEPTLTFAPQVNIQLLNAIARIYLIRFKNMNIEESAMMMRIYQLINKVEKVNDVYYNSREYQENEFVNKFQGYSPFNHLYEVMKLFIQLTMLKKQGDYQSQLPIAYDLIRKSVGINPIYKQLGYKYLYDAILNQRLEHYKQISIKQCLYFMYYDIPWKDREIWTTQKILEDRWKEFEKFKEMELYNVILKSIDAWNKIRFQDDDKSNPYPRLLDCQIKFINFKYFTHFSKETQIVQMDEHEQKILLSILKGKMFDKSYQYKYEHYITSNNGANARQKCLAILQVLNLDENADFSKFKEEGQINKSQQDLDFIEYNKGSYWNTHVKQAIYQAAQTRKQDLIKNGVKITEEELDLAMTWRYYIRSKLQAQN
eukprot:403359318